MGFNPFKAVRKIVSPVLKVLGVNPFVALGISLFLSWILRPKVPEIEDFGTNSFDDFERGLLVNKQSNDANIPVIYGERLTGGTRVFMETSGTDNTYLYMAIVMAEGEINEQPKTSSLTLSIVSHWADFNKKNGRKTNNTSQQRFFSTDVGMDFASQTVQDIKWGRE